jgi:hypothetical protein
MLCLAWSAAILSGMSKITEIPLSPAAVREEERRRRAREIAGAWRYRAAVEGRPQARDADAAIVEGLAFLAVQKPDVYVRVLAEIVEAATLCCQRDGHDRRQAKTVIASRIRPRREHDLAGVIPNFRGVNDLAGVHPPRNGRVWTIKDADRLNALVGHTPYSEEPRTPPLPPHTAYADG